MKRHLFIGMVITAIGCGGNGSNTGQGSAGTTGTPGTAGTNATAGTNGGAGTNATAGTNGSAGTTGTPGAAGTNATAGTNGGAGTTATAGSTGTAGTTGMGGRGGATGTAGSGVAGTNGGAGRGGTTGAAGTAAAGTTGTAGRGGTTGSGGAATQTATNVLAFHNSQTRNGVYVDAALTRAAVANIHIDTSFANTAISGPVYAQALYLGGAGSTQPDMVVVATAQNRIYALNAANGMEVWPNKQFGTPVTQMLDIPSGNRPLNPMGVVGTPVIDAATRTIYFSAMTTMGSNARHVVHAVALADGSEKSGWPVNLDSAAKSAENVAFVSPGHNQRAALALVGGRVFAPYSGHIGDKGNYHGWVVGISTTTPTDVNAWATRAIGGGIWGTSGIASDGMSLFVVTGNTTETAGTFRAPMDWGDGESVHKLGTSLARATAATDFFMPSDWAALDNGDTDLGGTGVVLFDVPGATPSSLVLALGKDGNAYLLDRANLGGMNATPVAKRKVASGTIIQAAAAYTTSTGTYFVFRAGVSGCPTGMSGGLMAVKVGATSPPTMTPAWCAGPSNGSNPMVSMTNAQGSDAIVWYVGTNGQLNAFNGDTGATLLSGAAISVGTVKPHQSPIVANGRVFVASDNRVTALTL